MSVRRPRVFSVVVKAMRFETGFWLLRSTATPLRGERVFGGSLAPEGEARELREAREECFGREPELLRLHRGTVRVRFEHALARERLLHEARKRGLHVAHEHDARARRQIVGQRGRLLEEERQIVFDARRQDAVADVAVDEAFARIARKARAPALPESP